MTKTAHLIARLLSGRSDASIDFEELRRLLHRLGFVERIRGSHFIFTRDGVQEILNLQPRGRLAKPYQVRQVRSILLEYQLTGEE